MNDRLGGCISARGGKETSKDETVRDQVKFPDVYTCERPILDSASFDLTLCEVKMEEVDAVFRLLMLSRNQARIRRGRVR